jgi:hypothetical protein
MRIKILNKIGKIIVISFCLYAIISLALVCWPIKLEENIKYKSYRRNNTNLTELLI